MEPNGMRVKDQSHYPTLQHIQGVYHDKNVFTASYLFSYVLLVYIIVLV